jgi:hypothetical protein
MGIRLIEDGILKKETEVSSIRLIEDGTTEKRSGSVFYTVDRGRNY